jgi:hypothetical protein
MLAPAISGGLSVRATSLTGNSTPNGLSHTQQDRERVRLHRNHSDRRSIPVLMAIALCLANTGRVNACVRTTPGVAAMGLRRFEFAHSVLPIL